MAECERRGPSSRPVSSVEPNRKLLDLAEPRVVSEHPLSCNVGRTSRFGHLPPVPLKYSWHEPLGERATVDREAACRSRVETSRGSRWICKLPNSDVSVCSSKSFQQVNKSTTYAVPWTWRFKSSGSGTVIELFSPEAHQGPVNHPMLQVARWANPKKIHRIILCLAPTWVCILVGEPPNQQADMVYCPNRIEGVVEGHALHEFCWFSQGSFFRVPHSCCPNIGRHGQSCCSSQPSHTHLRLSALIRSPCFGRKTLASLLVQLAGRVPAGGLQLGAGALHRDPQPTRQAPVGVAGGADWLGGGGFRGFNCAGVLINVGC